MFLVYNVVTEDRLTKGARDVLREKLSEVGMKPPSHSEKSETIE